MQEEEKSEEEKKEVGLYEKLAVRSKELIEEARGKTSEAVDAAIEKAKEEMTVAGDFSHEKGERLKSFLKRDLHIARKGISRAGYIAKDTIEPHRLAAGIQGTLATILEAVGDKFGDWADKLEARLDFKTGDVTTPGTLTCKSCKNDINMHDTGRIPPCPKCYGTEFHKSYGWKGLVT